MLRKRDLFLAVMVQLSWGLHTPLIKIALGELPSFTLLTMRFFLTGILFLPFIKIPDAKTFRDLVRAGIFMFGMSFAFIFLALERMDASTYVVLFQMQIPMGVLAGAIFFHEKIEKRTWLGIALAMAGVVALFGEPKVHQALFPVLLVFLACVNGVANNVIMKKLKDVHLSTFIAVTALIATPMQALLAFCFERDQFWRLHEANWPAVSGVLLYQAVGMSFAMMVWQRILSRNDLAKVNSLNLLFPFFSVVFSILILGEKLTLPIIAGGVMVLLGVAIVTLRRQKKSKDIYSVKELALNP